MDLSSQTRQPLSVIDPDQSVTLTLNRSCGECQACCEVIGVEELQKPYSTKCEYQCASGCSNYEGRPESCQRYHCLWREGYGNEEDRPDKLGVLLQVENPSGDGFWIDLYETRAESIERDGGFNVPQPARDIAAKTFTTLKEIATTTGELPRVDGVRIFLYGSKIPTAFAADQKYKGAPPKEHCRLFHEYSEVTAKFRFLVYAGSADPNAEDNQI